MQAEALQTSVHPRRRAEQGRIHSALPVNLATHMALLEAVAWGWEELTGGASPTRVDLGLLQMRFANTTREWRTDQVTTGGGIECLAHCCVLLGVTVARFAYGVSSAAWGAKDGVTTVLCFARCQS